MSDETYKMRRFDMYPDDWLSGTSELTLEEEAGYLRICLLIYSRGGAINDNDRWLAGMCRISPRMWRKLRQILIDNRKITVSDGLIHVERCRKELEKYAKMVRKQAESGSKGGRVTAERYREINKNKPPLQASATASLKPARALPSPSPSPKISKSDDYAFDGTVIRLKERDFTKWAEAFQAIPDLRASLQNRDDWLANQPEDDQRHWFISTSNWLANQNTRALAEQKASQDDEYDPDFIN